MGRVIDVDEVNEAIYKDFENTQFYEGTGFDVYSDVKETIDKIPTVEAIPKSDYEARLKADMVAMLEDISLEFNEQYHVNRHELHDDFLNRGLEQGQSIIQQKIDKLKGVEE